METNPRPLDGLAEARTADDRTAPPALVRETAIAQAAKWRELMDRLK
jgi:hypothetical protein